MELRGRVHNGVVVVDENRKLPEGAQVTIVIDTSALVPARPGKRIQLPLVPSDQPGALRLTAEDVAQALEDEDLAAGH